MKTHKPNAFHSPALIGGTALLLAACAALTVASAWAVTSGRGAPAKADTTVAADVEPAGIEAVAVEDSSLDCDSCGVVESVRRIAPVGKAAANYEFTIRIGGERRLIQDAAATSWKPGERMILIAGRES